MGRRGRKEMVWEKLFFLKSGSNVQVREIKIKNKGQKKKWSSSSSVYTNTTKFSKKEKNGCVEFTQVVSSRLSTSKLLNKREKNEYPSPSTGDI